MKRLSLSFVSILVSLAIIAIIAVFVVVSTRGFGGQYEGRKLSQVRDTVLSYIAQCYALEGAYPPDLKYLEDNYGLIMDTGRYIYHYDMFASNIFPDVKVLIISKAGE
jgi:hypothetical protein